MVGSLEFEDLPPDVKRVMKSEDSIGMMPWHNKQNPAITYESRGETNPRYNFNMPPGGEPGQNISYFFNGGASNYDDAGLIKKIENAGLLDVSEGRLPIGPHRLNKKRRVSHSRVELPHTRSVKAQSMLNHIIYVELQALREQGYSAVKTPELTGENIEFVPQHREPRNYDPSETPDMNWCVKSMESGADKAYFIWTEEPKEDEKDD